MREYQEVRSSQEGTCMRISLPSQAGDCTEHTGKRDAQLLKFGRGLSKSAGDLLKVKFIPFRLFHSRTIHMKCLSSMPLRNSRGWVKELWGWRKTCFLLHWINIYYIDSQVWASGFTSEQKWTHFSWCWVSISSPDPGFSGHSGRTDCGRTVSYGQRKLQRSTWLFPAMAEILCFCAESPVSALKSLIVSRDL